MTVYKRPSKKWAYEFIYQGVRYGKYHYLTKAEAREAEAKERARLKRNLTSTTFLQAATNRLDYVKAYCSPTHFSDNRTMLRRFMAYASMDIREITQPMIRDRLMELQRELGANRHLTSSLLASRGASLVDIKELLGHTSVAVTDAYLHALGVPIEADKRRRRGVMALLEEE